MSSGDGCASLSIDECGEGAWKPANVTWPFGGVEEVGKGRTVMDWDGREGGRVDFRCHDGDEKNSSCRLKIISLALAASQGFSTTWVRFSLLP